MSEPLKISASNDGIWITIAELARRKNITRQSAGERVARLERGGFLVTRSEGVGRKRYVDLAAYDRAVGRELGRRHSIEDVLLTLSEAAFCEIDKLLQPIEGLISAAEEGEVKFHSVLQQTVNEIKKSIAEKLAEMALNAENSSLFELDLRFPSKRTVALPEKIA
ncbi:hypothetical protein ASC97_01250 [Rhizobium sp. Root1203]|uniref:MarR family transcriptional regulator n=1 Tax=Rhizobium sp. Root1203 TaxID=1736427 RepID=UPI00070E8EEB|nr:helix-turn-helix domain-containing protein [Rhizobium sp. Root1203]KQV32252.1 hypothetical protein ASC97_01250 [Rhizobium sp. Root1203]